MKEGGRGGEDWEKKFEIGDMYEFGIFFLAGENSKKFLKIIFVAACNDDLVDLVLSGWLVMYLNSFCVCPGGGDVG